MLGMLSASMSFIWVDSDWFLDACMSKFVIVFAFFEYNTQTEG